MGFESFHKNHSEIETQVEEATEIADPTTYSVLAPEEMRVKLIRPLNEYKLPVRVGDDGETYYELSDKHDSRGQQAVARMLKGVLNVADVVKVPDEEGNDRFYSRKMPLEKIEETTTKEEVDSEQLLLQYLFNSKDHLFNEMSGWANNANYEKGKLAHFDFGEDAKNFLDAPTNRDSLIAKVKHMSPETIAHINNKLTQLQSRFDGQGGEDFLRAIVGDTEATPEEIFGHEEVFEKHVNIEPVSLLRQVIAGRIAGFKDTLAVIEKEKQVNSMFEEEE